MTQDLTTTSILSLFETTKEQRQSFVNDLLMRLESGEVNPLTVHLQVKCMEDIIKQLTGTEEYKKAILAESEKYGAKNFQFHNAKIEIKEVGVKYDFSKCDDPLLNELESKSEEVATKLKERQTMLKTIPLSGMDIMVGDELVKVYPPSKSSTTSVAVTLK